ncbi:MAG: MFS transporter [Chloroflexi bacterium HGW-Chloroflexi-4]|jgi:fucose permease|nr:MAG: MFS transporter [Chloroflexi bacterium HGW-Chloroflexi-4]
MTTAKKPSVKIGLILLAYIAFIALGMPDGLLGVGWPSMRAGFQVPLDALGFFMVASTVGYLSASFASGYLLRKMGVGGLLAASCGLTGLTLLTYTFVPAWWMMALLGLFGGLGAGAIDAGLNTYVAANFTEGLMQWLHASYGIGVTLGPILMTFGLASLNSWHFGYRLVAIFQIVLAITFFVTMKMWGAKTTQNDSKEEKNITEYKTSYKETLQQPEVWLSMLLFVLYVGAEMGLGAWAYTFLTESRGIATKTAGFWAGSFYALFTIGRILAGLYAKRLGVNKTILIGTLLAIIGAVLLWWNPVSIVSLIGVVVIGFAIAPIFPALMSGTSGRVSPKFAANTIGFQMMSAGIGGAILPTLMGILARRISLETIPVFIFALLVAMLGVYLLSMQRTNQLKLAPAAESQPAD